MTVGCVLIPRFSLIAALGDRREMLSQPLALAPDPGGDQAIGEVSGAAEAFGVEPEMTLSEALARCPGLVLVPPDPGRAEALWERSLARLEGIGAEVEPARPGEAFFSVTALLRICGPEPEGVLVGAGRALDAPARLGGGPTRLCAYAIADAARARSKPAVVPAAMARSWLEPKPVSLLRGRLAGPRAEVVRLVATLERLGVATLGDLAGLPRYAIADRFGRLGLEAQALAAGADAPLRPRRPREQLVQAINLPESSYGTQLDRALELLVERLLADERRRGRPIRLLRLEARLAAGGSWQADVPMRSATAVAEKISMAAGLKLAELPAPASSLALRALELAEGAAGSQTSLGEEDSERRAELLLEAVRQARAAGGRDALLRVVEVEPDSRIPERRAMLVPHS
jgi:protein ImuB